VVKAKISRIGRTSSSGKSKKQ